MSAAPTSARASGGVGAVLFTQHGREDMLAHVIGDGVARGQVRKYEPCIVMFTAQGKHQPGWLASQADMLAEDWMVVE